MKIPFIVQTRDSKAFKVATEGKPIIFGRMGSHGKLDDVECSRRHCMISLKDSELIMEDLESKNGTNVNGVKTTCCRIYVGDVIKIGNTKIMLDDSELTPEQLTLFSYKGNPNRRVLGEVTLQLDNNSSSKSDADQEIIDQQKVNRLFDIKKKR